MATDANGSTPADPAARRNTAALTKSQRTKAAFASTIGTTIEWYDFFLYGTAAALVFPAVFFPGESALAARCSPSPPSSSGSPPGRSARRSSATTATGSAARPR